MLPTGVGRDLAGFLRIKKARCREIAGKLGYGFLLVLMVFLLSVRADAQNAARITGVVTTRREP